MIVSAWNPPVEELEKTYLAGYVAKDATSLPVKNSSRFVDDKMIMVGKMGFEQSEILKTAAPASITTITLDGANITKFAHNTDDPVYLMRYDRVVFFSSATVVGSKTELVDLPVDVSNDEEKTYYDDAAGTDTTVYWTKYRNSVTLEETEFSDYMRATGPEDQSIGGVAEDASKRLRDPGFSLITPELYLIFANEVNDDLISQTERPYGFLRKTENLDRVAGQPYIDLPADYEKFNFLFVNNVLGGTQSRKRLTPIPYKQFNIGYSPTLGSDVITRVALDDTAKRILLKPTPRTTLADAFELNFYAKFARFNDFSNLIQTPNGTIYYYKFLAEGYSMKAERDPSFGALATKYEQKYSNQVVTMQRMNRKDVGTERSFMSSQSTSSISHMPTRRYKL